MQLIMPDLWTFDGLRAGRVFLLADNDELTLIDTSIPNSGPKIIAQIEAAGFPVWAVRRILITHAHFDHIGSLALLKERTNAEVYAPAAEIGVIEGREPMRTILPTLTGWRKYLQFGDTGPIKHGTAVDHALEDGERLEAVWGGLEVVATPGHTPGHVSFWHPERRLLITGDAMGNLPLQGVRPPPKAFSYDMGQAKASMKRLAALQPDVVCFGTWAANSSWS